MRILEVACFLLLGFLSPSASLPASFSAPDSLSSLTPLDPSASAFLAVPQPISLLVSEPLGLQICRLSVPLRGIRALQCSASDAHIPLDASDPPHLSSIALQPLESSACSARQPFRSQNPRLVSRRLLVLAAPLIAINSALAEEGGSSTSTALFSGGDARFLQASFEIKGNGGGVISTEVGRLADGTRAVRVTYDPKVCSYKQLLGVFWRNVDPTDGEGQFGDRGKEFRPVIYVSSPEERKQAETSQSILIDSGVYGQGYPRTIVKFATQIVDSGTEATVFTPKPEDGDKQLVGPEGIRDKSYTDAMAKSGRKKFFDKKYEPVKTTACEGGVCGFVYLPCTAENSCLDVLNGMW